MGYRIAAYPLAAFGAAIKAITAVLADLREEKTGELDGLAFADLKRIVGFEDYHAMEARYAPGRREKQ